jgi:hypothetical protein
MENNITKTCTKCGLEKESNLFYTEKTSVCRDCKKEYQNKYHKDNYEKIKKYRKDNKDSISDYNINYQKNKRDNNPELKEYRKQYRLNNIEKSLQLEKEHRERNRESIKISEKRYREKHRKMLYEKRKNKISSNPLLKSKERIRILIANSIRKMGYTKRSRTHQILGCSFMDFKIYIENQFSEGMSWDNHGKWHLDHKIPVSWGETEDRVIELNYYTNFQPLWASENLNKGNRFSN